MTKTHLLAALALTTATMTGCAVDATPCADDDCIEASAQGFAPDADHEIAPSDEDRDAAAQGVPARIAALQDWTLRLADGGADACDRRFVRYFAAAQRGIDLGGCDNSIMTKFVLTDEVEQMVVITPLSPQETRWMELGLDLAQDAPLTRVQEQMMVEADEAAFRRSGDAKPSVGSHRPPAKDYPLDAHRTETEREPLDSGYPLDAQLSETERQPLHRGYPLDAQWVD